MLTTNLLLSASSCRILFEAIILIWLPLSDYAQKNDASVCTRQLGNSKGLSVIVKNGGKTVRFSCNTGFILFGDIHSFCVNGNWSNKAPLCVNSECDKYDPTQLYATLKTEEYETTMYNGAVLKVVCAEGFMSSSNRTSYRACVAGKKWRSRGRDPFCKPINEAVNSTAENFSNASTSVEMPTILSSSFPAVSTSPTTAAGFESKDSPPLTITAHSSGQSEELAICSYENLRNCIIGNLYLEGLTKWIWVSSCSDGQAGHCNYIVTSNYNGEKKSQRLSMNYFSKSRYGDLFVNFWYRLKGGTATLKITQAVNHHDDHNDDDENDDDDGDDDSDVTSVHYSLVATDDWTFSQAKLSKLNLSSTNETVDIQLMATFPHENVTVQIYNVTLTSCAPMSVLDQSACSIPSTPPNQQASTTSTVVTTIGALDIETSNRSTLPLASYSLNYRSRTTPVSSTVENRQKTTVDQSPFSVSHASTSANYTTPEFDRLRHTGDEEVAKQRSEDLLAVTTLAATAVVSVAVAVVMVTIYVRRRRRRRLASSRRDRDIGLIDTLYSSSNRHY